MKLGSKNLFAWMGFLILVCQSSLHAAPKPKYSAALTDLWVIPTSDYAGDEGTIGSVLAGLVNSQNGRNMIWQEYGGTVPTAIANELQGQGIVIHNVTSVWQLVSQFRSSFNQGVQYTTNTPSINVATSLCGLWGDIPIEDGEVATAATYGVNIAFNADGLTDAWTYSNYGSQFTKGMVTDLFTGDESTCRDYGVAHKSFFFSDANQPVAEDNTYAQEFGPLTQFFGYIWNEYPDIQAMSQGGGSLMVTDLSQNLEALSVLPPIQPLQFPQRPQVVIESNVSYVAFVMTDGDNIGWFTGDFGSNTAPWWGSSLRGKFPMTWEISPYLATYAPLVAEYYYSTATANDGFVGCSWATGYNYPYDQPAGNVAAWGTKGQTALLASGLSTVGIIEDPNAGTNMSYAAPLVNFPEVKGGVYKVYGNYIQDNGAIYWAGCKPIVSEKFGLFNDGQAANGPAGVASLINAMPTAPLTNQASYALVCVSAWDDWSTYNTAAGSIRTPLWAVQNCISQLNSNVRVVTADQIVDMLQRTYGNCGYTPSPTPIPVACALPATFGYATAGASNYSQTGWLAASSYPLSLPATVQSLEVDMTSASGDAVGALAVYADNGGAPGTLIVQSNTQAMVTGWNYFPVKPTFLPAGNYWLGNSFGGTTANMAWDAGTSTSDFMSYTFSGVFPKTYAPAGNHPSTNFSIYANVCIQPTPVPTTTGICANWALVGNATQGTAVTLTTATNNQIGAAWNKSCINLTQNFNMTFKANLGVAGGADGIDFVLQNDARGTAAIGDGGGNKGYSGVAPVTPSMAFALETYNSNGTLMPQENGATASTCGYVSGTCPYVFPTNICTGTEHTYNVVWNATSKVLSLYIDGILVMNYNRDLVAQVFGGATCVYYGFTGATGGSNNAQYVYGIDCNTPTNTLTPTKTFTITSTPTATRTFTSTATATLTFTWTLTPSATYTSTPSFTYTFTRSFTPTSTSTPTFTSTNSPTRTYTATGTPTFTNSFTVTRTNSSTSTATATFTSTASPTSTFTITLSPTGTSTATRSFTPTFSNTSTFTATFTSAATNTRTVTPTVTASSTPTAYFTASWTNTLSPTGTSTATRTATPTGTTSPTSTGTSTFTPTNSSTPSYTSSSTATPTWTATSTNTFTNTPTVTPSATPSPTATRSSTPSFTATGTSTPTATQSFTGTATNSSTATNTATRSMTPSATASSTPSFTPTSTSTSSFTSTSTWTSTSTATRTFTPTNTLTATGTNTSTPSFTFTRTNTSTNTPTSTFTLTSTSTRTLTPTATSSPTPTPGSSACSGVPAWNGNFVAYASGAKVTYNGELYQCIQAHTSEPNWMPPVVPALWQDLGPCSAVATAAVLPNPATTTQVQVALPLAATSDVTLEVFTTNFRKVIHRTYPQTPVGINLSLELEGDHGEGLANGLYYIFAQAQGKRWVLKLLLLR